MLKDDNEKKVVKAKDLEENKFRYIDEIYSLSEKDCELAKKIERAARKIDRLSSEFRWKSDRVRSQTSRAYFSFEEAEQLHDLIIKYRSEVLQYLSYIYLNLQENSVRKKLIKWDEDYSDLLSDEVWVAISNDKIYARTPRMNSIYSHTTIRKGAAYTKEYYSFFAPEVERKLGMLLDKIPSFGERNVNILAVYNDTRVGIPNTINVDFKTVISALTCMLPGSAEATVCSFSMASVISRILPEGVYFTVESGFAIAPDLKENFRSLIEVFSEDIKAKKEREKRKAPVEV